MLKDRAHNTSVASEVGELFDVIAIGNAVIPQDVAVVPEALDDGGGGGHRVLSERAEQALDFAQGAEVESVVVGIDCKA